MAVLVFLSGFSPWRPGTQIGLGALYLILEIWRWRKVRSDALARLLSRRLSVLVGRAGTGKTSVMGALMLSDALTKDGIPLLAPTGKARVRLGKATNAEAMTVAQFLHRLGRYEALDSGRSSTAKTSIGRRKPS